MKQKIHFNQMLILVLFALYSYGMIKVILFKFGSVDFGALGQQLSNFIENPASLKTMGHSSNTTLLHTIKDSIEHPTMHNFVNLVGNVAIFIPFGFLAGTMIKQLSFILVLLLSFGFSLLLECSQFVFSIGTFDVDDLLLNTSGGLIGYLLWKICTLFIKKEDQQSN
ncbi:VanZ family protein [Neobacillus mesonae]|nr:VanZ family protein [Neobacillus mesonae]